MVTQPDIAHDLVVAMDYGQFLLTGGSLALSDPMALLRAAQEGDGIAADGRAVLVLSPYQNNFAMGLRVEVWIDRPPDDLDEWQEAFEATLSVDPSGQLIYDSPTLSTVELSVPSGRYEALVTGRGIVAHGWPGSTQPGDSWRLRLWPARREIVARRLRSWDPGRPGPAPVRPASNVEDPARWTDQLKQELLAQASDALCCRQAEAAALIAFDAAAITGANQIRSASTFHRLRVLLGDNAEDPNLMATLGLVSVRGQPVRGLPGITAPLHCLIAIWRGAVLAAGELTATGKALRLDVTTPTMERALGLTGTGRRLGLAPLTLDSPILRVVVREGAQALHVLGATETLSAWRISGPPP